MARRRISEIEQRGHEAIRRAGEDPIGKFLIRLVAPGARRELGKVDRAIRTAFEELSGAVRRAEGVDERDREVIDVDVEDDK